MTTKTTMRFRVWMASNGRWFWEVTDAYRRRLAADTTSMSPATKSAALSAAKEWIASHNGTADDWE